MTQLPNGLLFVRAWLANPRRIGAVAPSSQALARLMTRGIDARTGPVLELGPGTGVFTEALVARGIRQEDLTLVELNDAFAELLARRFPRARIARCSAARLDSGGIDAQARFGAVVSGLPLLAMPVPTVFRIVSGAVRRLEPGGSFYQFTYGLRCPIHGAVLDRLGLAAEKVGTVVSNVPPASVYRVSARNTHAHPAASSGAA